jgi:peptide/nickel transport system substrate-binding protein
VALTTLSLALTAAACGGSDDKSPTASGSGSAGGNGLLTADATYQPSTDKGGDLKLVFTNDCDYWDPGRIYSGVCWDLQRLFSRGLMMYDAKPGAAGTKPVADLAAAMPTVSADNKVWTYKLKDGIKFEDGTPITAQDIKYGIERVFAKDVINGGPTYVVSLLAGGAAYTGPYKDKKGLASIETPDAKTITFRLAQPFADWNYVMSMPTSTPVPVAKDTGSKYTFRPVSSGPYKFGKYSPNKSLTLVRNTQWSNDTVRKALPDTVTISMGLESNDIDNRLVSNQANAAIRNGGVLTAAQAKVLTQPALKKRAHNFVSGFENMVAIFTKNKPFDNINCRKAVAWVTDKKAQQLANGGPIAGGDIATTALPKSLKYFAPFDLFPSDGGQGDVAKAKEALTQCGYPNGFKTKIAVDSRSKNIKSAEALQADLKKIGITATIDQFDRAIYYSSTIGIPANVHKQKFGMAIVGWGADWPAPYGYFHFIADGREILAQGNSNWPELNIPELNKTFDEALAATDDAKRQALWTKADKLIVESAAYVPTTYLKSLDLVSEQTTNAYVNDAFGDYDFVSMGVKQ